MSYGCTAGIRGCTTALGMEQAMRKNFLGVKGMTLMGEVGLEFKRFAANIATQAQYPSSAVGANLPGT